MPKVDLFICNRCGKKEADITKLTGWKMGVLVECSTPTVGRTSPETVWCPPCIAVATMMPIEAASKVEGE